MMENPDDGSIEQLQKEIAALRAAINQNRTHTAEVDGRVIETVKDLEHVKTEVKSKAEKGEINGLRRTLDDNNEAARTKANLLEGKLTQVSKTATRVANVIDGKVIPDKSWNRSWNRILRNIRTHWLMISTIVSFVVGIITFFGGVIIHQYTTGVSESFTKASADAQRISQDLKWAEEKIEKWQLDIAPRTALLANAVENARNSIEKLGQDLKKAEEERGRFQLDFSQRITAQGTAAEGVDKSVDMISRDLKKAEEERGRFQLDFGQRMTAQETRDKDELQKVIELTRQIDVLQDLMKEIRKQLPSLSIPERPNKDNRKQD